MTDPYTGKVLLDVADAGTDDVADAFTTARAAQRAWEAAPPSLRADGLRTRVEQLGRFL